MIFVHHPEVELSRALLATKPEGCLVVDWTDQAQRAEYAAQGGLAPSAFPTVVVGVPAYAEDRPQFGEDGQFLGMAPLTVPAHEEALRMPAGWEAVASFLASAAERARLNPAL